MQQPLSLAAQMVFDTYYANLKSGQADAEAALQEQTHQLNQLAPAPFATIRALGNAPFIPTYTLDASFLLSGEDFFEDNPLIAASLKGSTRQKYSFALDAFRRSRPASEQAPMSLDHRLSIYIQERFLQDDRPGQRQEMANLICMLMLMYPSLRGQLGLARRCISGWKALKPSKSAAPFTRELAFAFIWYMLNSGRVQSATLLMLTFGGGMRVSEVENLVWTNVALPGDLRVADYGPNVAGLNIKEPKTYRLTGKFQFVKLEDPDAVKYLRALRNTTPTTQKNLVSISTQKYNSDINEAAKYYGLENQPFSSHSARIGKATEDFIKGVPVEQIAINCRWMSLNSLRYYINNGRAWILNTPITQDNQQRIKQDSDKLKRLLSDIPESPFTLALAANP